MELSHENEPEDSHDASVHVHGSSSTMMSLPTALANINEDDMSFPLSLIKGLRRRHHHHNPLALSTTASTAADSSSSTNTSDKDDSGGDEEGGSNTSSTSKQNDGRANSLSVRTFGNMSSLSGSEQEGTLSTGGGNRTENITHVRSQEGTSNATFSFFSEGRTLLGLDSAGSTGEDDLSEQVVVRGKSVTSSQEEQQGQNKVSFAVTQYPLSAGGTNGYDKTTSSKRRRNQDKSDSSKKSKEHGTFAGSRFTDEGRKHPKVSVPQEFMHMKNDSQQLIQQHQNQSVATVSHGSATMATNDGQTPGQDSCSRSSPNDELSPNAFYDSPQKQFENKHSSEQEIMSTFVSSKRDHSESNDFKCPSSPNKKHHETSEERRLERNQREKERSNKIASQVDTLRSLLQRGGLFIPKNTKSTVLSEASVYIKTLQDRQQLMHREMEDLKRQLVSAVGGAQTVMGGQQQSLQEMSGGLPPQTDPFKDKVTDASVQSSHDSMLKQYQIIFKNAMVGMCIASMGGALLDCNIAFHRETGISSEELTSLTIFNIVHRDDLSRALSLISRMIEFGYVASSENQEQGAAGNFNRTSGRDSENADCSNGHEHLLLRSAFQKRPDLGLCVNLVRAEDGIARCFSITLVKTVSPFPIESSISTSEGRGISLFQPTLPSAPSMAPQSPILQKPPTSTPDNITGHTMQSSVHQMSESALCPPMLRLSQQQTNPALSSDNTATFGAGLMMNNVEIAPQASAITMNSSTSPASVMIPNLSSLPPQLLQLIMLSQQQQLMQQQQVQPKPISQQHQQSLGVQTTVPQIPLQSIVQGRDPTVPVYQQQDFFIYQQNSMGSGAGSLSALNASPEAKDEDNGPVYYASG